MPLASSGFLKKKYGPLPGWAWLLVVAGGGYVLWSRRAAADAAAPDATQPDGTGTMAGTRGPRGAAGRVGPAGRTIRRVVLICPPGYHKVGGRCVRNPCPAGTHRVGLRCVRTVRPCPAGTVRVGGRCVRRTPARARRSPRRRVRHRVRG